MEEDLKILEEMIEKSKDLREEDFYKIIGIKQLQAISNLIKAYKEQQAKIEMAYRKGKEDASLEIAQTRDKLYEDNTLENIKLKKELEKKDKIINDAIIAVENLRQYFSEDLQPDFIIILEILKDKKVIEW